MKTIVITKIDGSVMRWSYAMIHMCWVILDMYSDKPTILSYTIESE